MLESPVKKKAKLTQNTNKRALDSLETNSVQKRYRSDNEESLTTNTSTYSSQSQTNEAAKTNFIKACMKVSVDAYFDYKKRFMFYAVPDCVKGICIHQEPKNNASQIPSHIEESFRIEVKTNIWCEVLDICHMCITRKQYMSASALKDVVEIILNAHIDNDSGCSLSYLLDKCQMILSLSFRKHPPCNSKTLKKSYNSFLNSPMDLKANSFTNRTEFGSSKGIVKYCWNRLEYELSPSAPEEPLVNRIECTPEEMKQSVKGLFWQKEKFEIFETLTRIERIDRLLIVLDSIIELLQLDLAIWHSRHTSNQGRHIMRSSRPLLAYVLWSDNILYTGAVNNNCRQIMRLFVDFICLGYSKQHINMLMTWLNTIIQIFYICETNSNNDFPNVGKYSMNFAKEFYNIILDLPMDLMFQVITSIQPSFMRYLISLLHIKTILGSKEDDIMKITLDFFNKTKWKEYPIDDEIDKLTTAKPIKQPKSVKKLYPFMGNICQKALQNNKVKVEQKYPKKTDFTCNEEITQSQIIKLVWVSLDAFLDAMNLSKVQKTLVAMNEAMDTDSNTSLFNENYNQDHSYVVTEQLVKKYKNTFKSLKEITVIYHQLKDNNELNDYFKVFETIV